MVPAEVGLAGLNDASLSPGEALREKIENKKLGWIILYAKNSRRYSNSESAIWKIFAGTWIRSCELQICYHLALGNEPSFIS